MSPRAKLGLESLPIGSQGSSLVPEFRNSRLSGLDSLRGISILLVLMLHSHWYQHLHLRVETAELLNALTFPLGTFGVPVFFIISGFLITYLLLREEERTGRISLRGFWTRRFLRIVPPVLIYLTVTISYLAIHAATLRPLETTSVLFFFRNLVEGSEITGHYWSLSLEEQFYVFWPLALVFFPGRWRFGLVLSLLVLFPTIRMVSTLLSKTMHESTMRLMRFDFILAGCLVALAWSKLGYTRFSQKKGDWLFLGGGLLATFGWLVSCTTSVFPCFCDVDDLSRVVIQESVIMLLATGVCFILIALVTDSTRMSGVLNAKLLTGIGAISYSLYLWQQFFFFAPNLPHFMEYLPARTTCAFVAACCGYYIVERPLANIRRTLATTSKNPALT